MYIIFRGNAKGELAHVSNVVIIQNAKVGDTVLATPMFRAVKEKHPNSKVYAVVMGAGKKVLENNKDADECIIYDGNIWALTKYIRSLKIDFAAIVNQNTEVFAAMFLAGVPLISLIFMADTKRSYDPPQRTYKLIKHFAIQKPFYHGEYIPKQYLSLLEPIGIKNPSTHLCLGYTGDSLEKVKKLLLSKNIDIDKDFVAAVAPGSKEVRRWPAKRYAQLINYLHKKYNTKFIFLGAGLDGSAITEVISDLDKDVIYSNALDQPMDELKATVSGVSILIANDTGPVTFAEAFDIPSVMIVGPTDEKEHHYEDSIHKMVVAPDRGDPVTYAMNWFEYDEKEALRQIRAVSLDLVKDAVESLMKQASA